MGLGKRHTRPKVQATAHAIEDTMQALAEFIGKEKVLSTGIWGFEGAAITMLSVSTKESICSIVMPGYPSTHLDGIKEMGWPMPKPQGRDLPRSVGLLYEDRWPKAPETPPEDDEGLVEAVSPTRVRRTRAAVAPTTAAGITRVRRTRVA